MHTAIVMGNCISLQTDVRSSSCVTSMELCNTSRSVLRYDSSVLQTAAKLGEGGGGELLRPPPGSRVEATGIWTAKLIF